MTIHVTHKKFILSALILLLIAMSAAGINLIPETTAPVEKVLPQKKGSGPAARKTTAGATKAGPGKTQRTGPVAPDVIRYEEIPNERTQEKTAEREEAYINDTPEKAIRKASLEKEIKALTEKKKKEVKEMSVLIKSFDEALINSQLPPEERQTKQASIEVLKQALMSNHNEKVSTIDSSLRSKVQQYHEMTTDQNVSERSDEHD